MANPNIPFIIKLNTDLIVGAKIRRGTGGDPAKEAANAERVIAVAKAIQQLNSGDVQGGMDALDAIIGQSADPANAQAEQTAISWVVSKAAAIQQALSGTLAGVAITDLIQHATDEAIAVANKYIPAAK